MKQKENFEDYSSGRVLYGAPGATNFPVRLANEIFQQCIEYLSKKGKSNEYIMYDPFCGAGYMLTVLGLIHGSKIQKIFGSDTDKTILEFAAKNLSLLSVEGIDNRISELKEFIQQYGKTSHKEALESAETLKSNVILHQIKTELFKYNITDDSHLLEKISKIDLLITDLPYGKLTSYSGLQEGINPVQILLDKIKSRLTATSIVVIVSDKKQKILHKGYVCLKKFKVGKRKIIFLEITPKPRYSIPMNPSARLHHYCQNITRGHLADVVEMYKLLDFDVVYDPGHNAGWIMVGQKQPRFAIQITEVDAVPIQDIDIKKRTHVAFISDDLQAVIKKIKEWATNKGFAFREGGWSEIERFYDLPDIFVNFVVEVMHTSIEEK